MNRGYPSFPTISDVRAPLAFSILTYQSLCCRVVVVDEGTRCPSSRPREYGRGGGDSWHHWLGTKGERLIVAYRSHGVQYVQFIKSTLQA